MKIVQASPLHGFRLHLCFEDGVSGEVDLSGLAGCGVFEAWLQEDTFDRVRVTEAGAVEWPGEIDLCPDALYMRATGSTGSRPEQVLPRLHSLVSHA